MNAECRNATLGFAPIPHSEFNIDYVESYDFRIKNNNYGNNKRNL